MHCKNSGTSSRKFPKLSNLCNLRALLCNFDECRSRVNVPFARPSSFPTKNQARCTSRRIVLAFVIRRSMAEHRQRKNETSLTSPIERRREIRESDFFFSISFSVFTCTFAEEIKPRESSSARTRASKSTADPSFHTSSFKNFEREGKIELEIYYYPREEIYLTNRARTIVRRYCYTVLSWRNQFARGIYDYMFRRSVQSRYIGYYHTFARCDNNVLVTSRDRRYKIEDRRIAAEEVCPFSKRRFIADWRRYGTNLFAPFLLRAWWRLAETAKVF